MKKAKIIATVNQKGGVGKTTTVVNLATACAALSKKKILVVDFDPQGNASTGLGLSQKDRNKSIYDVIVGRCEIKDAVHKTAIPNLFVIPATVDLSACEVEFVDIENREFVLREKLQDVIHDFDAIFIDCPPSLGLLTINALTAVDSVLIPMQCEFFSLEGLSHLLNTLELIKDNLNRNLKISGIILTMYDKRNRLTEQVERDVRDFLDTMVYNAVIPRNVKLSEAPSHGMPAIVYDSKCSGSASYLKFSKEFLLKEGI